MRHDWQLTNDLINDEQHLQESLILKTKAPFCDRGVVNSVAVQVKDALKEVIATVKITSGYDVGEYLGPITNLNTCMQAGQSTVKHEKGQVMLIYFWATWYPSCLKPMAYNEEIFSRNAHAWGDKVRIIGISIDKSPEEVKSYVEKQGWSKVEHYQSPQNNSCKSDFGVLGVPHTALIDLEGQIVFVGLPTTRNLE